MKLTELNPRWSGLGEPGFEMLDGITFDCPHCKTQRLGIKFTPPIDKHGAWEKLNIPFPAYPLMWNRTGDTFETLTLCPSVNTNFRIDVPGHWHGFIENGEIK